MEMAARQGNLTAHEDLALYHFKASGGVKNLAKAYFWATVAGDRSEKGENLMTHISVDLEPKIILEQMKKADEFKEQFKKDAELSGGLKYKTKLSIKLFNKK